MGRLPPTLIGLEFVVVDAPVALAFFVDVLGYDLLEQRRHDTYDADFYVLGDGQLTVTLLQPTSEATAPPFPEPEPRLAQLIFGSTPDEHAELHETMAGAGLPVATASPTLFHLVEQFRNATLGAAPALVFTAVDEESDEETQ